MSTCSKSTDLRSSDLQVAVSTLSQRPNLLGYRNLLSYVSSLGVRVFPKSLFHPSSWEHIGSGRYSTTWKARLLDKSNDLVAVKQPNTSFTREKQEVEHLVQHEALSSMIQELRILCGREVEKSSESATYFGSVLSGREPLGGATLSNFRSGDL